MKFKYGIVNLTPIAKLPAQTSLLRLCTDSFKIRNPITERSVEEFKERLAQEVLNLSKGTLKIIPKIEIIDGNVNFVDFYLVPIIDKNSRGLNPIHPGEILKDEVEEWGHDGENLDSLCDHLLSKDEIDSLKLVIRCKKNLSKEDAYNLEKVFGVSAEFWISLQERYDNHLKHIDGVGYEREEQES